MRRFLIILILILAIQSNCYSKELFEHHTIANGKKVFVYHLPDNDSDKDDELSKTNSSESIDNAVQEKVQDNISDDVTADTSKYYKDDLSDEDEENYDDISTMYSYVLKGYAEYNQEDEEGISLELSEDEIPVFNIKKPLIYKEDYFASIKATPSMFDRNIYSKYNGTEYLITPLSGSASKSMGGFSAGTTYCQGIDYGELEQSSGIYSKYQYKNFALSTSYAKTVNTTNNNYNDNFYITPELRLSQYFTLKNIFSADTVKKRKKAEIVLSVNPFGNKDYDRLRFEFGASETYDDMNNLLKSQFRFSTNYRF